jgi:hypothetical protein
MHHRSRRRLSRATSTGFALAVVAASAGIGTAAHAAPAGPAYSASSSASLIRVTALDATPLGAQHGPAADLKIATAGSTVNSKGTPQSSTGAAYLDGAVGGQKLPAVPQSAVRQQAAPDNVTPAFVRHEPVDLKVAKVGLGNLRAHARWNAGTANPTGPVTLTEAAGAVANVTAIPGGGLPAPVPYIGSSVLDLPHTAYAQSKTDILKVHGQRGLGVSAQARVSAAQLTVFRGSPQQHTIKIISPPTLTATATGTHRSSVTYTSPLIEVVDASGRTLYKLDTPDKVIEIPLSGTPDLPGLKTAAPHPKTAPVKPVPAPSLPGVPTVPADPGLGRLLPDLGLGAGGAGSSPRGALLRLSLGHVEKKVSATTVDAKAATLRLEVLDVPQTGKVLDVAIGELRAAAKVPAGGLLPPYEPTPTPSPSPSEGGSAGGGKLPVTGVNLTLILAAGVGLLVLGRFAMVMARR